MRSTLVNADAYQVLFDFAKEPSNTVRDVIIVLLVSAWVGWWIVRGDTPAGQKMATLAVVLIMLGVALFQYFRFESRRSHLTEDVRAGRLSEIEGRVTRRIEGGAPKYFVGQHELDVSWRHPALDVDNAWIDAHLRGKCARIHVNPQGDVLWAAVRGAGCQDEQTPSVAPSH